MLSLLFCPDFLTILSKSELYDLKHDIYLFTYLFIYLFYLFTACVYNMHEPYGGREIGRERENPSRLHTVSAEPHARMDLWNRQTQDPVT